jgi:hypothetical protein
MKRPIHVSHRMGKNYSDVRAPAGTARFYSVRQCKGCQGEEIMHAAGQFTDDDLVKPCSTPAKKVPAKKSAKKSPKKTTTTKRSR